MAPPKKTVKMDLGSFLADDSLGGGSWADEEVDMSSIAVASANAAPARESFGSNSGFGRDSGFSREGGFGGRESGFGGREGGFEERRERKEFPIPDQPPYRARVGNLPWELTEDDVVRHFEDRMQAEDIISEVKLPQDRDTGRLKGFAFVTFNERDALEDALQLNLSDFNGRKIFVNVAAPQRDFDGEWRRGSGVAGGRSGEDEPELDWGSARNSRASLPPRERSDRGDRGDRPDRADRPERTPRKEEPDLDWGSARHSQATLPPRERSNRDRPDRADRPERIERPKKEEPELDWGSARTTHATLAPRERSNRDRGDRPERSERPQRKQEPEFDWGSARVGAGGLPPREKSFRSERPKKQEPALDWKRGQALPAKTKASSTGGSKQQKKDDKKEEPKPQKSSFSVLAVEGDSDEEKDEEPVSQPKEEVSKETGLESAAAELSVEEPKDNEGWEVVGK